MRGVALRQVRYQVPRRIADQVPLQKITACIAQCRQLPLGLDAFGYDFVPKLMGQIDYCVKDQSAALRVTKIADQRAVNLDLIDR